MFFTNLKKAIQKSPYIKGCSYEKNSTVYGYIFDPKGNPFLNKGIFSKKDILDACKGQGPIIKGSTPEEKQSVLEWLKMSQKYHGIWALTQKDYKVDRLSTEMKGVLKIYVDQIKTLHYKYTGYNLSYITLLDRYENMIKGAVLLDTIYNPELYKIIKKEDVISYPFVQSIKEVLQEKHNLDWNIIELIRKEKI